MKFEVKEQPQENIDKIKRIKEAIEVAEEFDLPHDHLYEELNKLEGVEESEDIKEVKEDAPFHRVFMLIEINQDDFEDEAHYLYLVNNCSRNILYTKAF